MDDYIVRIYRWGKRDPARIVGGVEQVGVRDKRAFRSLDELWSILTAHKGGSRLRATERAPAPTPRI